MAHRRVRHLPFSAKSLGASLALFSPAITGYADGDPVGTWDSVNGLSLAASASAGDRPTYVTAGLAGIPIVRFVSNLNRMTIANGFTNTVSGSNTWSMFILMVRASASNPQPAILDAPGLGGSDFFVQYEPTSGFYWAAGGGVYRTYSSPSLAVAESAVLTFTKEASTAGTFRKNNNSTGSFIGTLGSTPSGLSDFILMDYRSNNYKANGDVGAWIIIVGANNSIISRLNQSLGFTFRISQVGS